MILPKYLEGWTSVKKEDEDSVLVETICECGNAEFCIFRNVIKKTSEDVEKENEVALFQKRCKHRSWHFGELDGKRYMYRKNLFGKIVDKAEVPDSYFDNDLIIKIECSKCRNEHVAFDSRIHGYDAFIDDSPTDKDQEFEQIRFEGSENDICSVHIEIINQFSFEDFIEASGDDDIGNYSNAFGCIEITALVRDLNDKKVVIISEETS